MFYSTGLAVVESNCIANFFFYLDTPAESTRIRVSVIQRSMSCCHHVHWLLQTTATTACSHHCCELGPMWLQLSCCSDPINPVFSQESIKTRKQNHGLLFLQNYNTCLYYHILTKLQCNVAGEVLINDTSTEQQLFKLVWAHCTTYP